MNLFNLTDLVLAAFLAAVVGSLITLVIVMRERPDRRASSAPRWERWNVEAAETLVKP